MSDEENKVPEAAPVAGEEAAKAPEAPAEAAPVDPKAAAEAFMAEYGELVKKHGYDFASYPVYVPDGAGGFKTIIQSTPVNVADSAKRSPFVAQAE